MLLVIWLMSLLAKGDVKLFPFLRSEYHKQLKMEFNEKDIDQYLWSVLYYKHHIEVEIGLERVLNRFIGCCLVVQKIKSKKLTLKFCDYEASLYTDRLEYVFNTDRKSFFIYLDFIFQEIFKCDCFIDFENGIFSVSVPHFFKLSKNNKDLALVNQSLMEGQVIFDSKTFFKIVKNVIKNHLMAKIEGMNNKKSSKYFASVTLPPVIEELVTKYEFIISNQQKEEGKQKTTSSSIHFNEPPCITKIKAKFEKGEDKISHMERFILATFLFSSETPMEDIKEIFSKAPNYDEKVTDYQLYQIQKNGYIIPSCSNIEMSGFCYRNTVCGTIKNPIQLLSNAR